EPAAMDVEDLAKIGGTHGRALDVPARTTPAPRAFPAGFGVRRLLPEHKIGRVFFVGVDRDARPGLLLVELSADRGPVFRIGLGSNSNSPPPSVALPTRDN